MFLGDHGQKWVWLVWSRDSKINCITKLDWWSKLIFCMLIKSQNAKSWFNDFWVGVFKNDLGLLVYETKKTGFLNADSDAIIFGFYSLNFKCGSSTAVVLLVFFVTNTIRDMLNIPLKTFNEALCFDTPAAREIFKYSERHFVFKVGCFFLSNVPEGLKTNLIFFWLLLIYPLVSWKACTLYKNICKFSCSFKNFLLYAYVNNINRI